MKLCLTGSAGFICSNMIRNILYDKPSGFFTKNDKITSIDKVSFNSIHSLYWNKNHSFHIADILDAHCLDVIFQLEKPNLVIHFAAETAVDASIANPSLYVSNNVLGTQNIINACVKHKVKKLVLCSTDEIMGQLTDINQPGWTETDFPNPRNPYSASKLAAEFLVQAAYHTYNLEYNIVRSSNNYGARQQPTKLIPKVIKCILNNQKIPLFGKGQQIRDWTYVNDNCQGIIDVIQKGKSNEIYNISSNCELTNLDMVKKICGIMKKSEDLIEFIPDPRFSHDWRYSLNTDKIRCLGWKPTNNLDQNLEETINWYRSNAWFFKD